MRGRIAQVDPERRIPAVGDRSQGRIETSAQLGHRRRQRVVEILVFAPAEAVPRHHDPAAKPFIVLIQRGD
jgi:hypothetical protein